MGLQFLLLVLLCRAWPWAWASEAPLAPVEPPLTPAQVANGSQVAVIVMVTVMVSSKVPQSLNSSGSQSHLAPSLSHMLQRLLFVLSGCFGLVALYFLARAFSLKVHPIKKYQRLAIEDHLERASVDSDEETVFEMRLYQ